MYNIYILYMYNIYSTDIYKHQNNGLTKTLLVCWSVWDQSKVGTLNKAQQ